VWSFHARSPGRLGGGELGGAFDATVADALAPGTGGSFGMACESPDAAASTTAEAADETICAFGRSATRRARRAGITKAVPNTAAATQPSTNVARIPRALLLCGNT
jgi:hypothetical protein